jgi:hypothetical protein
LLIEQLRNSGSFATTHFVVARLLKHTDFSALQIEELVQIGQSNNQVRWIVGDSDVHGFFALLIKHKGKLSTEVDATLKELVEEGKPEQENDGVALSRGIKGPADGCHHDRVRRSAHPSVLLGQRTPPHSIQSAPQTRHRAHLRAFVVVQKNARQEQIKKSLRLYCAPELKQRDEEIS